MMDYDVADYLANEGLGTLGTTIFAGYMPDSSGTCLAVYQARGFAPLQPVSIERPELHVVCRAASSSDAMNKVNDVYVKLHMSWELTLNGVRYLYFRALGSPALMYADYTHDLPQFYAYVDFEVHKENE